MWRNRISDFIPARQIIFSESPHKILNYLVDTYFISLLLSTKEIVLTEISFIQITGRPSRAIFKSEPMGYSADSYNLTWKIDSYAPIEEYKLMFRKLFVSLIILF